MEQLYVICGSGSFHRYNTIKKLKNVARIDVIKPEFNEYQLYAEFRELNDAESLVLALGKKKASFIVNLLKERKLFEIYKNNNWIIVTGDQVVVCDNKILEKPQTETQVYEFYKMYNELDSRNRLHTIRTVGSVVLTSLKSMKQVSAIDISEFSFTSPIPLESVSSFVEPAMNAAGALIIEHPLIFPHVSMISGTLEAIQGLDPNTLKRLISELNQETVL